jgi:hypothetical protein
LTAGLDFLNRVQRRRAVVFLLSDFLDTSYERALRTAEQRHDIVAVPITDPWERHFPSGVRLRLEDAESGRLHDVRSPRLNGPAREEALRKFFRRSGTDAVWVDTAAPFAEGFRRLFDQRTRRR